MRNKYPFKVLIRVDDDSRVIDINSSMYSDDSLVWIEVDEGFGDKYLHAQGNYLPNPLMDEFGILNYKYEDGCIVERTPEEKNEDYVEPVEIATDTERIEALEEELSATKIILGLEE